MTQQKHISEKYDLVYDFQIIFLLFDIDPMSLMGKHNVDVSWSRTAGDTAIQNQLF